MWACLYVDRIPSTSFLIFCGVVWKTRILYRFQWNTGCRAGLSPFNALLCFRFRCFFEIKSCACVSLWICCFLTFHFLYRFLFFFQLLMNGFAVFWWLDWCICGACFSLFLNLVSSLHTWPAETLLWPCVCVFCPTESLHITSTLRLLSNPV